jgi:hypothetical protein
MSHIFNLKSKYNIEIVVDKQLVSDGVDYQKEPSLFVSMGIKLFDEKNKEMLLTQEEKDEIIVVLSKIRSTNEY